MQYRTRDHFDEVKGVSDELKFLGHVSGRELPITNDKANRQILIQALDRVGEMPGTIKGYKITGFGAPEDRSA